MSSRTPTVMIVEDSEITRALLRDLLEEQGRFHVLEAVDAPTALATARDNTVDLVFLDLVLPVMDGIKLAEALRAIKSFSTIPIVALSNFVDDRHLIEDALQAGCTECLYKPNFFTNANRNLAEVLGKYGVVGTG